MTPQAPRNTPHIHLALSLETPFGCLVQIDVDSGDTIEVQTQGALNKIDALLGEAGASKHDVVFAQVLLKSMDFYAPMNEVYGAWVDSIDVKPARAAFAVDALPADALVEIVVQAIRS